MGIGNNMDSAPAEPQNVVSAIRSMGAVAVIAPLAIRRQPRRTRVLAAKC